MRKKPTKRYYNYQILDTDYTNYSIVYTCVEAYWGLYHSEAAWIISRAQEPSSGDKTTWLNQLESYGYDVSSISETKQGGNCVYTNRMDD